MASNTALNSEIICDLQGQPLHRNSASLLKAIDKLLTVGAYYSAEHDQYKVVSEKTCDQIVAAIQPNKAMGIEITASGMMIRSQLVDPNHRNVRLLHDLLVPLNIARLEISANLTASDLRQAISALQSHKQNLGNTEGFQEIKIENLPATVNTASRSVTQSGPNQGDGFPLDEVFGSSFTGEGDFEDEEFLSESELLAREFMNVVGQILENLENENPSPGGGEGHPDSTPDNLRALRDALKRLVEVNPDPRDLARLIEHAKRALDLSQDPRSVDLVFSLLKSEIDKGDDWKQKGRDKKSKLPRKNFKLSLAELRQQVADLQTEDAPVDEPLSSSGRSFLGICIHLLSADPSESLELTLAANLEQAIADPGMTRQDLDLCATAVTACIQKDSKGALDRTLPAFIEPLRTRRPEYLPDFWLYLWNTLDSGHRVHVWPHLVGDLLLGLDKATAETIERMWLAAAEISPKAAVAQVSRLENTPAVRDGAMCKVLMRLPLPTMYPVHLALMNSSQALQHGQRLHDHLFRQPPNSLTEILMKALGKYDPENDSFYLELLKQSGGDSITLSLRRRAAGLISDALKGLPRKERSQEWVLRAIGWFVKLDPGLALPILNRICNEKKFFFFPAWPEKCRSAAQQIIAAMPAVSGMKEEG